MQISVTVSTVLMLAGIPLLLPAILPLLHRKYDRRGFLIASSAVLHLIATLYALAVNFTWFSHAVEPYGEILFLLSFGIGLAAGIALLLAAFCEPDGKIRFFNRRTPIPVKLLACILLPVLTAGAAQQFFSNINFVEYGFSLSVFLTVTCLRFEAGEQLQTREADLELQQAKLLTEQIQPHFIFNVLMSIQNLCYQDADAAADCIAQFARYLRGNMNALTAEKLISFETELEHIREYEALEHACTDLPFALDYTLGVTDFEIPALTVQPIVENALQHGLRMTRRKDKELIITAKHNDGRLFITIEDNGAGMDADEMNEQLEKADISRIEMGRSIGIMNVNARIKNVYGNTYGIHYESDHDTGTRAIIILPIVKLVDIENE